MSSTDVLLLDFPGTNFKAPRPFKGNQNFYSNYIEELMDWVGSCVPEYNRPIFYVYLDSDPGLAKKETLTFYEYNQRTRSVVDLTCDVYKLPYSKYASITLTEKSTHARIFHSNVKFFKLYLNQLSYYLLH